MINNSAKQSNPLAALAEERRLPLAWLKGELGVRGHRDGRISIPYYDGAELFARVRNPPGTSPRFLQPQGVPLIPYGRWRLDKARRAAHLYLGEGETDTWALWHCGLPALGLPGAAAAGALDAEDLEGIEAVYLLPDADEAGWQLAERVRERLRALGWGGKLYRVPLPAGCKDVSEWHVAAGPDRFLAELQRAVTAAERLSVEGDVRRDAHPAAAPKPPVQELPPYRPFPVRALPGPLAAFVEQAAAALGCDAAYVALPALAAVFACVGNTRRIRLKRDWTEPAVAWFGVVGESGTLKSPAQEIALAPLERVEARLAAEREELLAAYDGERGRWQLARKAALKDGKELPAEPEAPPERRAVVSDVTVERLAELLEDNPRGLLLAREELAGWLGSFSRYRGQTALESSDLPHWLQIHGARPLRVDRKTGDRRTVYVPHAAVSLVGGVQPGTLARCLTPAYFEAGLVARLLLAMPPRRAKGWTEAEVASEVMEAYEKLLGKLLALDFEKGDQGPVPFTVRLSPEAMQRWVAFYTGWAAEQNTVEGEMAALFSKLEGYAARLALAHHVVSKVAGGGDDADPVEPESVDAAVELTRWFAVEAERIYLTLDEDDGQRQVRRLLDLIRGRGGGITVRELMTANRRRYPTAEAAEAALGGLVEAGLAAWKESTPGPKGGRPVRRCVLRITHHTTHTTGPDGEAGDPEGAHTTPDGEPLNPENPRVFEGCVSSVMRDAQGTTPRYNGTTPVRPPGGSVTPPPAPDLPGDLHIDPETGEGVCEI
jgi:hypothetical protein